MKGDNLTKTKILSFIFFLIIQLILTAHVSNTARSEEDPAGSSFVETGEASWYGPGFHGRKTANGERFNTYEYTAAHKTLPFGTLLKVTNLGNNLSTVVRINDRGPFHKRRIIDLSKASKEAIGMDGIAQVKIQEITEEQAEMIRQGFDPFEKFDESEIDTNTFKTIELYDTNIATDSKIFLEFTAEDGSTDDFELNKNLKSNGNLKIKIITPKTEEDMVSNLYQKVIEIDTVYNYFDLLNQPAVIKGYLLEIGNFTDKSIADRLIGRIEREGFSKIYLEEVTIRSSDQEEKPVQTYKVLVGLYDKTEDSKKDYKKLKKLKFEPKLVKIPA
jgi:rare lipoprotein A